MIRTVGGITSVCILSPQQNLLLLILFLFHFLLLLLLLLHFLLLLDILLSLSHSPLLPVWKSFKFPNFSVSVSSLSLCYALLLLGTQNNKHNKLIRARIHRKNVQSGNQKSRYFFKSPKMYPDVPKGTKQSQKELTNHKRYHTFSSSSSCTPSAYFSFTSSFSFTTSSSSTSSFYSISSCSLHPTSGCQQIVSYSLSHLLPAS